MQTEYGQDINLYPARMEPGSELWLYENGAECLEFDRPLKWNPWLEKETTAIFVLREPGCLRRFPDEVADLSADSVLQCVCLLCKIGSA